MRNTMLGAPTTAALATLLLLGAWLGSSSALAGLPAADGAQAPERGAYSIGHTTLVLTDTSRNPDGSTPVTSAGRPLYLHLWYPSTFETTQHVRYTWNNPLYNQNPGGAVYPGLPDVPALSFTGSSSAHAVAERAALAKGKFPLLVAAHGLEVAAAKNMPDTLETLASHGYIVASVEITGDDDAYYQGFFLETFVGLSLGPNPTIHSSILQRSKDVSFVISAVLEGVVDQKTGTAFAKAIDADSIGILGYSLGGETSLATVTGISAQGLPADRRVKAAFMGSGSNYGLVLNSADYANAKVPLMFFGNDTGIAYENFNAFTHSSPKYLVDIAGLNHHVGGYQSSWCQDFHNSMIAVNPGVFPQAFINPAPLNPTDIADYVFDATFYFSYTGPRELGIYNFCPASVFDGISDAQLVSVLFGDPQILTVKSGLAGSMPLEPELPISETTRLTSRYAVSFFDATLKHHGDDSQLADSADNRRSNPLVHFVANCEKVKAHPIDLRPGDRITFIPVGNTGYDVSVTSGATLLDPGTTQLPVGASRSVALSYPGFSFSVPGIADPISTLIVNEHGAITSRTSADYPGVDDNGSPWYMRGQLLLTNRFTIGALMKDLDSTAAATGGGVFAYYDATNARVVVTYKGVPAAGTTEPNTLQIAIYGNGKIEMIVGSLAATGAVYSPTILGTIGIASGQTKARDLRKTKPIRFSELRNGAPVFLPLGADGAIYEQFSGGIAASCPDDDDEGAGD
jgi:dienelactone hydrolase